MNSLKNNEHFGISLTISEIMEKANVRENDEQYENCGLSFSISEIMERTPIKENVEYVEICGVSFSVSEIMGSAEIKENKNFNERSFTISEQFNNVPVSEIKENVIISYDELRDRTFTISEDFKKAKIYENTEKNSDVTKEEENLVYENYENLGSYDVPIPQRVNDDLQNKNNSKNYVIKNEHIKIEVKSCVKNKDTKGYSSFLFNKENIKFKSDVGFNVVVIESGIAKFKSFNTSSILFNHSKNLENYLNSINEGAIIILSVKGKGFSRLSDGVHNALYNLGIKESKSFDHSTSFCCILKKGFPDSLVKDSGQMNEAHCSTEFVNDI